MPLTSDFDEMFNKSKSLTTAKDDGFVLRDRADLVDRRMILQRWEIKDGMGSRPYAKVWAVTLDETTGAILKIKFEDGGRSRDGIVATLQEMNKNQVKGGVAVILRGEEYDFTDNDTGELMSAVRYSFEDPSLDTE